jgi:hypothetical protein
MVPGFLPGLFNEAEIEIGYGPFQESRVKDKKTKTPQLCPHLLGRLYFANMR